MNFHEILPHLNEKFAHFPIQIEITENENSVFQLFPTQKLLVISRHFLLLHPAIQKFIICQLVYMIEDKTQHNDEEYYKVDTKAFQKVVEEYGEDIEGILFLSMKLILTGPFKDERITNLYYQLSNKNQ